VRLTLPASSGGWLVADGPRPAREQWGVRRATSLGREGREEMIEMHAASVREFSARR